MPRKKSHESHVKAHGLRQIRAGAQTLRGVCPTATLVNVQLEFLADATTRHATQSFVLSPGARAVFVYPCPAGSCDGTYDLSAQADQTLNRQRPRMTGLSSCQGTHGVGAKPGNTCGLVMRYTIVAKHSVVRSSERSRRGQRA